MAGGGLVVRQGHCLRASAGQACHTELDHGVDEHAELVIVFVGSAEHSHIHGLQARPRGAAQFGCEQAAALVVGQQPIGMLTGRLQTLDEGTPSRFVEGVAVQG